MFKLTQSAWTAADTHTKLASLGMKASETNPQIYNFDEGRVCVYNKGVKFYATWSDKPDEHNHWAFITILDAMS